MENYVQMSLDAYDKLMYDKIQKQEYTLILEDKITKLTCQLEIFKEEILNDNLLDYRIRNNELKVCTEINDWGYALDNSQRLLKLGFTIEEMNEFIKKKWEEIHSIKEEEENE